MTSLKDNENIFVLGLFLGITGLLSALVLAVASDLTAGPREEARQRDYNAALKSVLPDFDNLPGENTCTVKSPAGWEVTFSGATLDGKLVGVAGSAANPSGYAGPIEALAGLAPDGTMLKLLITSQNETPGLGSEVCVRKFRRTIFNLFDPAPDGVAPNPLLDQFTGKIAKSPGRWRVKSDGGNFDARTGATITSKAVVQLANEISCTFNMNRAEILGKLGGNRGGEK